MYRFKILEVDLDSRYIGSFDVDDDVLEQYLGGSGLAARLFLDRFPVEASPLSAANPLLILTGPLSGSAFPGSSRFVMCAKSPLTGIWGESAAGGRFGPCLTKSGFDGILITGAADDPTYLTIEDGKVEIRSAHALWGLDAYETSDRLKTALGAGHSALTIGQAGEHRVFYPSVCNDKGHLAVDNDGVQMLSRRLVPHICVPTTAGTGSEVTWAAVIKDREQKAKRLLFDHHLAPDTAVLDPNLLTSLPRCVADGADLDARGSMQMAAAMAGMAFGNAMVCLIHATAHSLGAVGGVPHGLSNAILLPHCMRFNKDSAAERYALLAAALGLPSAGESSDQITAEKLIVQIEDLLKQTGLPQELRHTQVTHDELAECAALSLTDGSIIYNPEPVFESEQVLAIYEQAW